MFALVELCCFGLIELVLDCLLLFGVVLGFVVGLRLRLFNLVVG